MTTRNGGSVRYDPEARLKQLGPALVYSRFGLENRLLYGDFEFFVNRAGDGFIPYMPSGRLNLALGMPLAPFGHRRALVEEFLWFCKRRGRIPAFFPVTRGFFDGLEDLGFGAIPAGVAGRIVLGRLDLHDASFASVRQAVGQMRSDSVSGHVVPGEALDSDSFRDMADLVALGDSGRSRRGALRLLEAQPLACAERKWYVLARRQGSLRGFMTLVAGSGPGKWGIESVVGDKPESTLWDFLWMEALGFLKSQGATDLQLGVVPLMHEDGNRRLAAPGEAILVGHLLRWWLNHSPALGWVRSFYRQQLRFRPHEMETQYLVFHPAQPGPEILAGFLGGMFEGFDLGGLGVEWWRGWLGRLPGGRERDLER